MTETKRYESYTAQDLLGLFSNRHACIIDFQEFEKVVARTMELYFEKEDDDLIYLLYDLYKRSWDEALQDLEVKFSELYSWDTLSNPHFEDEIAKLSKSYKSLRGFLEYGRVYCNRSQSDYEQENKTIQGLISRYSSVLSLPDITAIQPRECSQLSPSEIKCSPELLALIDPDKAIGDIVEFKKTVTKYRTKWFDENDSDAIDGQYGPACFSIPQFVDFLKSSLDKTIGYLRDLGVNNSRPLSNGCEQDFVFFTIDGAPQEVGAPGFSWVLNGAEKILAFGRAHGVLNQVESARYAQLIVTTAVENIEKRVSGCVNALDQLNFKTASDSDITAQYTAMNRPTFVMETTPEIAEAYEINKSKLREKVVDAARGCISARLAEIDRSTGRLQVDRTENRFLLETKQMLDLIASSIEFFSILYDCRVVSEDFRSSTLKSLRSSVTERLALASEMGSTGLALETLQRLNDDLLVSSEKNNWLSEVYKARLGSIDIGLSPLQKQFYAAGINRPLPGVEQRLTPEVAIGAAGQTAPGNQP